VTLRQRKLHLVPFMDQLYKLKSSDSTAAMWHVSQFQNAWHILSINNYQIHIHVHIKHVGWGQIHRPWTFCEYCWNLDHAFDCKGGHIVDWRKSYKFITLYVHNTCTNFDEVQNLVHIPVQHRTMTYWYSVMSWI